MKKKKVIVGVAAGAAVTGLAVGTCVVILSLNQPCLYGPPPDYSESVSESLSIDESLRAWQETSAEEPSDETFDPSEMEVQDVYGPPEYFEGIG